jgi:ATP-binding cassette subfamily B protein
VVARAFAKDSPIKVYDEPSSALDPIAEYELFESILDDSKDKLTLFISHRLSSVKNASNVMMLERGTVLEQGTHHDLMERDGSYAGMYSKQAKNYLATEVI